MARTMIPIPPSQWVKERQKRMPWGSASISVKTVAPVVVKPDMDSKTAGTNALDGAGEEVGKGPEEGCAGPGEGDDGEPFPGADVPLAPGVAEGEVSESDGQEGGQEDPHGVAVPVEKGDPSGQHHGEAGEDLQKPHHIQNAADLHQPKNFSISATASGSANTITSSPGSTMSAPRGITILLASDDGADDGPGREGQLGDGLVGDEGSGAHLELDGLGVDPLQGGHGHHPAPPHIA